MDDPKSRDPKSMDSARNYFLGEIRSLIEKRKAAAEEPAIEYLVNLLTRYIETEALFEKNSEGKLEEPFLVGIYNQFAQGTPEVRKAALQRLGDVCMMVTGFFADSLNRKLVDMDYYFQMGGSAYWQLSKFGLVGPNPTYQELAVKFKMFSDVLNEMSDRSGLQNNADILRLYERWLLTKNDRLKNLLLERGIGLPVDMDTKVTH